MAIISTTKLSTPLMLKRLAISDVIKGSLNGIIQFPALLSQGR